MALSKPAALNTEEAKLLRSLLTRVQASGTASQFADVMTPPEFLEDSDGDFEHLTGGLPVMSDATKRRLVADSPTVIDHGYGKTRSCAAAFEAPSLRTDHAVTASSADLPEDVKNMKDWSATILEIGKLAPKALSYAELAESDDPAVKRYLKWLMSALTDHHQPQYHDLVAYLNVFEYGKKAAGASGFVRHRKGQ